MVAVVEVVEAATNGMAVVGVVEAAAAAVAAAAAAVAGVIVDTISTIVIDDMMTDEAEAEATVITKIIATNVEVEAEEAATNMDRSETKTTIQAAEV